MHAIQTCCLMLQMTENMEKWSKIVSEGGPKIHQKSWKVNTGTFQGSSECIFTRLDHQNGSQGPPNDRKLSSGDSKSGSTPKLSGAVLFENTSAGWGLAGQQSEESSKLNRCKPCISSNPSLTSGCNHKGGRRQGRSLRIYLNIYPVSYTHLTLPTTPYV